MKTFKKITLLFLTISLAIACSSESSSSGCETCEYTIASGETAGTAAKSIEGTYNLTMHFADAASPYPDGTKATFTLMDNVLTVEVAGEECITIKNPRLTTAGSTEIQFRDTCRDKISYDVSMTQSGELNEINISSTVDSKWLGQFNDK
ncbi:hypothetical protein H9W90_10720 [Polaribacter pectinis]|uniref:Lipocalin-like domain-containing protein n=1 Tax=Polaribacter pectinis TaxID=2738844 RepID=A0A7G9L7S0_9FLAO|nr:hypothetical protein [Polaribacter pectinis]QNM84669.1 hypothetical protein H9W90_10720 [Polaribacter pectinis]